MRLEEHLVATLVVGNMMMLCAGEMTVTNLLVLLIGGVMIDVIDHGLWGISNIKPLTMINVRKVGWDKFHKMDPSFYFFHTAEVFLITWWVTMRFVWGKYLIVAYGLHLLMDGSKYVHVWKNLKWLPAWSVIITGYGKIRGLRG